MATTSVLPMNDNAPSTAVVATTGSNGTYVGANTEDRDATGPGGIYTAALDFTGSDRISLGTTISAASGTQFGLSIWFYYNGTNMPVLVGRSNNASTIYWTTTTNCRIRFATTNSDVTFTALTTGWHHFCVSKDGSDVIHAYLDGTESSTTSGGTTTNTATFSPTDLGYALTSTWWQTGPMAGLKIFNAASDVNAATLYAEGSSSAPSFWKLQPIIIT